MAKQIIDARVRQKVGTEAEWLANDLELLDGEAAIVRTGDGTPVNLKFGDGNKKFSELPYFIDFNNAQRIPAVSPGALPTPTEANTYMVVTEVGSYTFGGSTIATITEEGYQATLWWTGTTWVNNGSVRIKADEDLETAKINKGKAYPYVNQPTLTSAITKINNALLDVVIDETTHSTTLEYTITLLSKNATTNNWGNGVHIRVLNKSDLSQATSIAFRSTDTTLDADTINQLNKMQLGGLQMISIFATTLGRTFHLLIDTDAISDGEIIDAQYSDLNNKMYFAGSVYNKVRVIPSTANLATKQELDVVSDEVEVLASNNSLSINKGKSYPFLNQPTDSVIATVNECILDVTIYGGDYDNYTYSIVGLYKQQSTFGNGIVIFRTRKSDNLRGGQFIHDADREANTAPAEQRKEVGKISLGGIQTIELKVVQAFGGFDIKIVLDTDSIPVGYTNFGNGSTEEKWINHIINPAKYLKALSSNVSPITPIPNYDTFKEALQANAVGLLNIGQNIIKSIVETPASSGNTSNYYPSQIGAQYAITNTNYSEPKTISEIITIKNEDGTVATIKSFGKRYIYFGNTNVLYRTQEELKNKVNTHLNTQYEKLVLPNVLPDSYRNTSSSIMNAFELDNGELLIEVRNGIKENEADDYRGHRVQLYLTDGFKDLTPTMNVNNVLEYDLDGIVSRVWQYKAWTTTVGKVGTTFSMVNNVICISPYYIGLVGLVFISRDFGQTWKTIFNMGVEDAIFSVPYKGSEGAYPLPQDLNPAMASDMWTAGGNSNFHVHGVTYDPIYNRIWVSTGDAGTNYLGRTALWYTDDDGLTWTRMQTKGTNLLDSPSGIQPMGVVVSKDYVLVGTDSATDGLYRYSRKNKVEVPELEAVYWYKDTYSNIMRVIFGGSAVTKEGYIYSVFFPNTPTNYSKGVINFTIDGINFKEIYFDEINNETSGGVRNIEWGTFIGKDRFGNIYAPNPNGTIIKLY